jgi:hypothetical protein
MSSGIGEGNRGEFITEPHVAVDSERFIIH